MLGAYVDVQSYHQLSVFTSTFLGIIILSLMTIGGFYCLKIIIKNLIIKLLTPKMRIVYSLLHQ